MVHPGGLHEPPAQYDPALERGCPPLAKELEELDALAQPALHHLRRAHHLVDDRGNLRCAEVERFVELLDRVEGDDLLEQIVPVVTLSHV